MINLRSVHSRIVVLVGIFGRRNYIAFIILLEIRRIRHVVL